MPATPNKGYSVPTPGTESGTWGSDLNTNTFATIDLNLGGTVTVTVAGTNVTLSAAQAQNGIIRVVGVMTAALIVFIPYPGIYVLQNATNGAFMLYVAGPTGSMKYLPTGQSTMVQIDAVSGANVAGQKVTTVGMVAPFVGINAPPGWQKCDGSLLDRTAFADLWAYAQSCGNLHTDADWNTGWYGAFSEGNGTTTFRVPDLRGIFPRSWSDSHATIDPGRSCGTIQQNAVLNHTHPANSTVTDPGHTHPNGKTAFSSYNTTGGSTVMYAHNLVTGDVGYTGITVSTTTSNNSGGGAENRPINTSLMYCISIA